MTAGGSILSHLPWPIKPKKRERSGSGGSWDLDRRKKSSSNLQYRKNSRKPEAESTNNSSLEICTPAISDVEFKYTWPIDGFIQQVKTCKGEGLDSKPFEVNVNGMQTTWNLSVRFWIGENGERLSNPFVLCLNLLSCKVEKEEDVTVKYKFGIYNRVSEEPEMGTPDKVSLKLNSVEKLQSIGFKNIAMNEKHINAAGDIFLYVRMTLIRKEEAAHSLSSDLGSLINDEKSSDLILEAGERKFMVHKNILAARSPVFANLLAQLEEEMIDQEQIEHQYADYIPKTGGIEIHKKLENIIEGEADEEEVAEAEPAASGDEKATAVTTKGCDNAQSGEGNNAAAMTSLTVDNVVDKVEKTVLEEEAASVVPSEQPEVSKLLSARESSGRLASSQSSVVFREGTISRKQSQTDIARKKKLVIDDLSSDTVEELLKYIYTDNSNKVEVLSQTLLAASERYKLPGLKQHCEKHLGEIITPLNVADILLLSENYCCRELKRTALAFCGENHSYIMKDAKWKTIEQQNPALFEEAAALVAPETCKSHSECLKKGGNRYDVERNCRSKSNSKENSFGRKKSYIRKI